MVNIKLCSFNVRGLRDSQKRTSIFNKLKENNSIIFLQETHTIEKDIQTWTKEWGNHVLFSHGTSASRGVAILFPDKLEFKFKKNIL